MSITNLNRQIEELIRAEGLDDIEALLTPREFDEVPFVSRFDRLDFLSPLDVRERSRVLLTSAVKYLDRIVDVAARNKREDVVVMVSLVDWADLDGDDPDPVIPNFWLTTDRDRDLGAFRLRPGVSKEASQVSDWLRSADLLRSHEVLDPADVASEPDLQRVYVAQKGDRAIERLVLGRPL